MGRSTAAALAAGALTGFALGAILGAEIVDGLAGPARIRYDADLKACEERLGKPPKSILFGGP